MSGIPEIAAGQPALGRRIHTHPRAMAQMRAALGAPRQRPVVRALAGQAVSEPALALLDAFAVVADTVGFYTDRWATEGYLRTATERYSIRELARVLGQELRPGLAATTDLVVVVDDADDPQRTVTVPAGTAVQSVPGGEPGALPQVFETTTELIAHAGWNAVPAAATEPQVLRFHDRQIWLRGGPEGMRRGAVILVAGDERLDYRPGEVPDDDIERFDLRRVDTVKVDPAGRPGWTVLTLDRPLGFIGYRPLMGMQRQRVWQLTEHGRLFGSTAPDPTMIQLGPQGTAPPGTDPQRITRPGSRTTETIRIWRNFQLPDPEHPRSLEVAGDQPTIGPNSWLVLEQDDNVEAYRVTNVEASGQLRFGVSGPLTRVELDTTAELDRFDRRQVLVHFGAQELNAARYRPRGVSRHPVPPEPGVIYLEPFAPLFTPGQRILVRGRPADSTASPSTASPGTAPEEPVELVEPATVTECTVITQDTDPQGHRLIEPRQLVRLVLAPGPDSSPVPSRELEPASMVVHGNVAPASHGATVTQVLGSGDGTTPFLRCTLSRPTLTHLRPGATGPSPDALGAAGISLSGAVPELEVRVDGVRWHQVQGFAGAGPADRVYRLEHREGPPDGGTGDHQVLTDVVFGDGVHGALPPTGIENITATYRAGLGAPGAVAAGSIMLPVQRPLGMRSVSNPGGPVDWAPPETLEEARATAPRRIRTLERVVSVADAAALAGDYAGVGQASAELVWDGRRTVVVVCVLGVAGKTPDPVLITELGHALDAARDPRLPILVVPATVIPFGVRVDVAVDPDHRRDEVLTAVRGRVVSDYRLARRRLARPISAAEVLLSVRTVPGVRFCTMPHLRRLVPGADGPEHAGTLLVASGARWEPPATTDPSRTNRQRTRLADSGPIRPAELLAVRAAAVEVGEAS